MTVHLPESIHDNLRFLCVEVDSQLASLNGYFKTPTKSLAKRILDRRGYAYNLKMRIHNSCLSRLAEGKDGVPDTLLLRGVELVATDLERITDLCRDCVKQMGYIRDLSCLKTATFATMLQRVQRGIGLVEPSIQENDTQQALKIGQIEDKLDRDYQKLLRHYLGELKGKTNTEDLTGALFVAHILEQMGDALLDISEAIISTNLGQPLNFERYQSLQATVEKLDRDEDLSDVQIEPIAETRSGSAISGITASDGQDDTYLAIFKDGVKRKVKEERQGVESWHEIYPGLAPRILSYKKRGQSAALLIEHLPGLTFEQILLNESQALLDETLAQLGNTLKSVWRETDSDEPVSAHFIDQLVRRLPEVYKIHPEFQCGNSMICALEVPSFDTLVAKARQIESGISAPFSVYIHGDFNVDNIIYDPMEQRINFIDLHRSRYMDYVQDVSVFMVSNYRLQTLDAPLRRRIMRLALDFYRIARRYADKKGDTLFELRLALGLARSFATSTRFILDKSLARDMFLRARYLLETVVAAPKKAADFRIPLEDIFVG